MSENITTDPKTPVGKVRLITGDKYEEALFFTDDEIQAFIGLHDGDLKLAAAEALETMASMETVIQKKIQQLDLRTDGPAVAQALREHAKRLREEAYTDPAFEVFN